jgi:glycosyltransferase involved in cell wall biosynthesis
MPRVPRRIRVVTLTDLIGPIGGAERLAALLAGRLDPERFESSVVVTRLDPAAQDPESRQQVKAIEELAERGVPTMVLDRTRRFDLVAWRRVASLLHHGEIDVLHAHKHGSNIWGSVLGSAARTPVVVAHEHTWSFEGEPVRKFFDRHVIARLSDVVVAVSRADAERMTAIEGIPPEKIRYIPNGSPPSPPATGKDVRAELGIAPGAPVVGAVGILRPQKAFEVLVDAAARLRRDHPDLQVLIAGYGPQYEFLQARIAEHGLEGVVRILGIRPDVPDVLRAFDVAVLSSDFEGMPMAVLEYMEAGRPTVATNVGGLPDMIDEGVHGHLVPPRDPDALAAAIDRLLRDPAGREAMGRAAQQRRADEFGLDAMVSRLEELYVELLERRRRPATA